MRDAFGGAFMIKIFLVFIFIYICFTSIALNYAKAFKVKNEVIEYLEKNEITDLKNMNASEMQEMEDYFEKQILSKLNYKVNEDNFCDYITYDPNTDYCNNIGIVILNKGAAPDTQDVPLSVSEGTYHTVHTYIGWSTGFLKPLLALNGNNNENQAAVDGYWTISGETRVIVRK